MSQPLSIAFVWHMHQPPYRDPVGGGCLMPWVRLHGTKDYLDMLTRLESFPTIHQTFNLVPSLLDQIEDYLPPHNRSDAFLDLSRKPAENLTAEDRRFLLEWFFLAHPERMIRPHARYHDLLAKRGLHPAEDAWPQILRRFKTEELRDLQVWFNLVWIDPWLRRQDERLAALERKGRGFTEAEKGLVLDAHLALLARILPAYREAAQRGQIELSTSPYYHPILPLWCDLRDAHAALPHLPLPPVTIRYPQDARWHIAQGMAQHEAAFGRRPDGLWPPEGSVSEAVVHLALEAGLTWIATDEAILWRTLKGSRAPSLLYRPHLLRRGEGRLAIVFRDRELSDLIGFVYSQWQPREAVADFVRRLGEIHEQFRHSSPPALVTIILDGENAWEFYPNDGHEFLTELYGALSTDARFRCVTVSEYLAQHPVDQTESLPPLFAGSWIDGNFATWVGHPEKNAAWERLAALREALANRPLDAPEQAALRRSLGMAQASDWMWWFGDTHVTAQAEEFDRLFRQHVANSYRLAGAAVPAALAHPIKRRPSTALHDPTGPLRVTVDGRETSYYEWLYAGRVDLRRQYAAIHRGQQVLQGLAYGFDDTQYFLRIDLDTAALHRLASWTLEVALGRDTVVHVSPDGDAVQARLAAPGAAALSCALRQFLELALPLAPLAAGDRLELTVVLKQGSEILERYPGEGAFSVAATVAHLDSHAWSA